MPRPLPLTTLVTQTDVKDLKHADDCGPATDAMLIYRGTSGRRIIGWRDVRAAMAKRGIKDVEGESNFTNVPQNIRAILDIAPELKGRLKEEPSWTKARECLEAGGGLAILYYYGAAPKRLWSPLVSAGTFAHFAYVEAGVDGALLFDPMYRKGAKPGKISWDELQALATHGPREKAAGGTKTHGYMVLPDPRAQINADASQAAQEPRQLKKAIDVSSTAQQVSTSRKSGSQSDLARSQAALKDAMAHIDWSEATANGLAISKAALAAAGKGSTMSKIKNALAYIASNTQLDEMLLDATRSFVLVSISVALGLGIPLLQIDGPNWSVVLSAGLASALQVIVKFLDPDNSAYGITRK